MHAVSTAQMQRADRLMVKRYGIPVLLLMDSAGRAVAEAAKKVAMRVRATRLVVFCGSGNNGGDGVAAARYLRHWGYKVTVFWMKNPRLWQGELAQHYCMAKAFGVPFRPFKRNLGPIFGKCVIVDALLGTGTHGEIRGAYRDAIEAINHSHRPVVAVDIPSGLDADFGKPLGIAVKSTVTVTMAAPKVGMLKPSARRYVGKLIVADIGIPKELLKIN